MTGFHPLVSIIIPVYKGADYMREAIDSALAQTYDNCEVIVVNDGSPDNGETERIALSYGDRIRYFAKENGGVATALNLGIREMRGEYFSWLSHDDLYLPEKVAMQVEALRRLPDRRVILYSDFYYMDAQGVVTGEYCFPDIEPGAMFCHLYENSSLHGCSLLIPRCAFDRVGFFPEHLKTTQDYELWFAMARVYSFVRIPHRLIQFRLHEAQGTNCLPERNPEELALFARHLDGYMECKKRDLPGEKDILRFLLALRVKQGRFAQARYILGQCASKGGGVFAAEMRLRHIGLVAAASIFSRVSFLKKRLRPIKRGLCGV
ncbi:Glycosyltransferase [uncultured delta proteobacterium]|uniref:Glycosyltransferase n=1 Tax=uncultured delta proteobacterium TaxID=34034 RepID=A0A212KGS3_9DELT|nr:Glycosyltransferase [uncultured delta proteobacterium]